MRIKPRMMLAVIFTVACFLTPVCCENAEVCVTAGEGWSWESGAPDIFDGWIDMTGYEGRELTVRMSTDLPYDEQEEKDSMPVFVSVNGSRITMAKQTDAARCTPSAEAPVLHFSGRLTMPVHQRAYRITFRFVICDEDGQELKTVSAEMAAGDSGAGNVFFIPWDTGKMAVIIAVVSAAVWAAAVTRAACRKKKKTGE